MSSSNALYDSDDSDDVVCPLCCEPMDLSDKNFLPCPCGYRVCMWCWHRIKENYTNLCPACRSEYSDNPHVFAAVDKDEVIKNENNKKKRAKQRETDSAGAAAAAAAAREHQHALHLRHRHQHQQHMQHLHREQVQQSGGRGGGGAGGAGSVVNRRELANMRVVQRNLVYITGLPAGLDSEEVLRRPENFGQYGKVYKIAISVSQASEPRSGNLSAHITFAHKEDALACILATDGFWLEGRQLRSNFGTTKYCATYLRNSPCSNPDCLYLHELGDEEDRFTKEEIQQRSLLAPPIPPGAVKVTGGGGPSGTGMRCNSPYLPPPVYQTADSGSGAREGGAMVRSLSQGQQGAGSGVTAAQRAAARAKPAGQAAAAGSAPKPSTSVGIAWGGAGATNGPSAQSLSERRGAAGVMTRGKGPMGVASPSASPHLQAHNPTRLQEEWPSLADTATPAPAPTPTPAAPTTNRTSRNRRKKEKQQQQQLQKQKQQSQEEGRGSASPSSTPIPAPQEVTSLPPTSTAAPTPAPASTAAVVTQSPPTLSQPPGLGPIAGSPALPIASGTCAAPAASSAAASSAAAASAAASAAATVAVVAPGSGSGSGDGTSAGALLPPGQDALPQTTSSSSSNTSSMFSNTFFSNGGPGGGEASDVPPTSGVSTAPAPPGFSSIAPATLAVPTASAAVSSSSPSTVASASPSQPVAQPVTEPVRSLFEDKFSPDGVFDSGMFSSATIGGGLFAGRTGTGVGSSIPGTGRAGGSPPPGLPASPGAADASQGLLPERSPPSKKETPGSPVHPPEPRVDTSTSEVLHRPAKGLAKSDADGDDLSFAALHGGTGSTSYDMGGATATSTHVSASPFGASGGGHFGGAFGSALFPVSTHQHGGGGAHSVARQKTTDGPGADLSVDPFANSSGALARMLGVTLPPVDSQSSLASKMRSGVGVAGSPVHSTMQDGVSPPRSHLLPRVGNTFVELGRDMGRVRPGGHVGPGKGGVRDVPGIDRNGGHRNDYGGNQQENHQASRFSFAQDENPGMPFSPVRGSPPMGPDLRASPGGMGMGMGSPARPGQHHHLHHHQSHAHRPFGVGQPGSPPPLGDYGAGAEGQFAPPPPPHHHHSNHGQHHFQQQQQQQQYSIQNGMAFLQKVLPGVSLSYGAAGTGANRQSPPAGAGGGGGQGQGQSQGQTVSGVATSGGVGWGDTTTQRVDPAQAFGSSLWTMAPSPAPRQPQGSRGGGFGAW